jgi:hypothetical protein
VVLGTHILYLLHWLVVKAALACFCININWLLCLMNRKSDGSQFSFVYDFSFMQMYEVASLIKNLGALAIYPLVEI